MKTTKKGWMCLSNFVNLTKDIQNRQYKNYAPMMEGINHLDELRMLETDYGPIPVTEACSTREALEHIQYEFKLDALQLSAYHPDKACAVAINEIPDQYKTECAVLIPAMSSPIELFVYNEPKLPKLIKKMTTNSEIITDEMERCGYKKIHERSVEVEGHKKWIVMIFSPIIFSFHQMTNVK